MTLRTLLILLVDNKFTGCFPLASWVDKGRETTGSMSVGQTCLISRTEEHWLLLYQAVESICFKKTLQQTVAQATVEWTNGWYCTTQTRISGGGAEQNTVGSAESIHHTEPSRDRGLRSGCVSMIVAVLVRFFRKNTLTFTAWPTLADNF